MRAQMLKLLMMALSLTEALSFVIYFDAVSDPLPSSLLFAGSEVDEL